MNDGPATSSIAIITLMAHALTGGRDKAMATNCVDYHPKSLTQMDAVS